MKKHIFLIMSLIMSAGAYSQVDTLAAYYSNGMPGRKVPMKPLYYAHPLYAVSDSVSGFDSAGYWISSLGRNATNDSIVLSFLNGRRLAVLSGAASTGAAATAAGPNNSVQLNVSNVFAGYSNFTFIPSLSASSGLGRSMYIAPGTLTASASNDTLVGVDIANPTFSPGTISNTKQFALRVQGAVNFSGTYSPTQNSLTDYSAFHLNRRLTAGTSGVLKAVNFVDTLVASANGQDLYGLSITPAFVDGSYTGVNHYALNLLGAMKLQAVNASSNIEATGYIYSGTAVRIGNNGATGKINVTQDASTYDQFLRFDNTEAGNARSWVISPAYGSLGALVIKDMTAAQERFRISNNGNIMINTQTDVANKIFNVASTTKASHPYPSMTLAQRTAMTMAAANIGDHVYQTDGTEGVYVYKSTGWILAY